MSKLILIVEDDEVIQEMATAVLKVAGYTIEVAGSGAEMYEKLAATTFDLIILDLGLPDGDALPHIIELRKSSDIPVIILTGRQRIDDRLMALGLGADDYLTKPFDARELSLRVSNILARSGGQPRRAATSPAAPSARAAPPPVAKKSGRGMVLGLIFIACMLGAGAYLYLSGITQQQTGTAIAVAPEPEAITAEPVPEPVPEPAPEPVPEPVPEPAPEPAPELDSESETSAVEVLRAGDTADENTEDDPLTKAEILGYGWVLNSKCKRVPDVAWWKYRTREDIANYVVRKKSGDWALFIQDQTARLAKLYDIAERDSTIVTKTKVILKGEKLNDYVGQFAERLSIARCLAEEAKAAQAAQ